MTHKARVTEPSNGPLSVELKWDRPLFSDIDGIGDMGELSIMDGMILALGFIDETGANACGSGVMVAPGLMITANHVVEEMANTAGAAFSFLSGGSIRIWAPKDRHILATELLHPVLLGSSYRITSDVTLVACTLISEPEIEHPLRMAQIEIAIPEVGERLWAVGYRELSRTGVPGMGMLCSSGLVTECHLKGRGKHLVGPCVEVAMNTLGGMSGGPVFNSEGHLVGIVSTSYEADDLLGPTFVSLVWPAAVGEVAAHWPTDFWPGDLASLQTAKDLGYARVHGQVKFSNNVFDIDLPTAEEKR
ncbi:trypsin-like peptidase domain-containing protein [Lysobacter sp. F60174L2]|uniref:trypsin-like peptidase domain-containing protein n=1 Tax=Lysobacter sp. F60174L2 TaxID=3459295 RepID=UPI00403DFACE